MITINENKIKSTYLTEEYFPIKYSLAITVLNLLRLCTFRL